LPYLDRTSKIKLQTRECQVGLTIHGAARHADTGANGPKKTTTSIVLYFDEAMDPSSASTAAAYSVAAGVKKGHKTVYIKAVKIRHATYDAGARSVTLQLPKPIKSGSFQVTVHGGIAALNGTATRGDFKLQG
jgi:hypothetical protein